MQCVISSTQEKMNESSPYRPCYKLFLDMVPSSSADKVTPRVAWILNVAQIRCLEACAMNISKLLDRGFVFSIAPEISESGYVLKITSGGLL